MGMISLRTLESAPFVFAASIVLRIGFLLYGNWQDQNSPFKFTDIDYYVFTGASRNVYNGRSPYDRDTYRYTPLLAWLLIPTAWGGAWFHFGKVLFALADVGTGWFIYSLLRSNYGMNSSRAAKYSTIWLLNPMVATISTRGSSEGILAALVMAFLWLVLRKSYVSAGCMLGLAVHFKIYPFIYGFAFLCWFDMPSKFFRTAKAIAIDNNLQSLQSANPAPLLLVSSSLVTMLVLNTIMFSWYGLEFLEHTYLYHITRTDHRHNFSPYNMLLYVNASPVAASDWHPETFAFLPQLALSCVILPLILAKHDLGSAMLAQTLSFVTFNKVCTSQYFLWYMVFLPLWLPSATFTLLPRLGFVSLILWIAGQGLWLQQGYKLEFLGQSSFIPGLLFSSLSFFIVNIFLLGEVIMDVRGRVKKSSAKKNA